MIMAYK